MTQTWLAQWIKYRQDLASYKKKLEEWDVVLPPQEPISLLQMMTASRENWVRKTSELDLFVDKVIAAGGIKRKVLFIVLDTGAKSKSNYLQRNFVDIGKDHTTDNNPFDEHFHFSHVLSSITGDHPAGLMGLCNHPKLPKDWYAATGQKVLNRNGSGSFTWIANGTEEALNISKKYLNLGWAVVWNYSLGGYGSDKRISDLFVEAERLGVIIMCAAGNSGNTGVMFPATDYNTIAVAATDSSDNVASFSSRGPALDVACGGVNIWGADFTQTGERYASGTSMATPNQAAIVGIMLGAIPDIKNRTQLLTYINKHITDAGTPGKDNDYGLGITKLSKYPVQASTPTPEPPKPEPPKPEPPKPEPPKPEPVKPQRTILVEVPDTFKFVYHYGSGNPANTSDIKISVEFSTKEYAETAVRKVLNATRAYMRDRGYVLFPDTDIYEAVHWLAHFYEMIMRMDYKLDVKMAKVTITTAKGETLTRSYPKSTESLSRDRRRQPSTYVNS